MKSFVSIAPAALGLALALSAPRSAGAHIQLTYPPARTLEQKTGPCGSDDNTRSTNVTVLQPGQKIVVEWDETVEHPGHFRISFDEDGADDFATPASSEASCSNDKVLVDLIPDRVVSGSDGRYRQEITLPSVECETCTLQLIQVMTDKPPYTTDAASNDLYFQCADLALRGRPSSAPPAAACQIAGEGGGGGEPAGAGGGPAGAGGRSGASAAADEGGGDDGCALGGGRGGVGAWLVAASALAALATRRRRRALR
ncbi:MAG TPA: SCE4755 family polysaccharide monooxygenase-like protein [Polyangiaceae bacterium]|nr:SCE4755 family polysaccharide monooxygenase-like protein [Polyangiaceae bacterium]